MFYTESISYPVQKPSLFSRLVRAFEISGMSRAARELHRLGYYEEYKRTMIQIEKLKNLP